MKTKIFVIALLCLMVVSIQGAMVVNAKMGSITFHVFKDMDYDKVFDEGEPSPPWTIINLKKQSGSPFFMFNRLRLALGSGEVTYRFAQYPCDYQLVAHYERNIDYILWEDWTYEGILHLDEKNIGSIVYVPLNGTGGPI